MIEIETDLRIAESGIYDAIAIITISEQDGSGRDLKCSVCKEQKPCLYVDYIDPENSMGYICKDCVIEAFEKFENGERGAYPDVAKMEEEEAREQEERRIRYNEVHKNW